MKARLVSEVSGLRTFVVVLDKGDEAAGELTRFAAEHAVTGAGLTGVGACRQATLGYLDPDRKAYLDIPVREQSEVLSLVGDFAVSDGRPALHAHVVLGHRSGATSGGHLKELVVWPTLEVVVTETPAHLHKRVDPEVGIPLIALDETTTEPPAR